jgi:hypothetical protein
MARRAHASKRTDAQDSRREAETEGCPQAPPRRLNAAWFPLIAIVGLIVGGVSSVAVYRSLGADPATRKSSDPRQEEIEEMIRRYFRTWSSQDMKGYGDCFLPNAGIQFIHPQGKIEQHALPEFLAYQEALLRQGHGETETPESIDIRFEARLARAVVYWKLTADQRVVYGYDHFTLLKQDGKWGIVNLVFYETKRSG